MIIQWNSGVQQLAQGYGLGVWNWITQGGAAPASVEAHWEWKVASLPQLHFAVDATPLHFVAADLQPIGFVAAAPQIRFKTNTPPMHFRAEDQE